MAAAAYCQIGLMLHHVRVAPLPPQYCAIVGEQVLTWTTVAASNPQTGGSRFSRFFKSCPRASNTGPLFEGQLRIIHCCLRLLKAKLIVQSLKLISWPWNFLKCSNAMLRNLFQYSSTYWVPNRTSLYNYTIPVAQCEEMIYEGPILFLCYFFTPMHRGLIYQFSVRSIHFSGYSELTERKTHLGAMLAIISLLFQIHEYLNLGISLRLNRYVKVI